MLCEDVHWAFWPIQVRFTPPRLERGETMDLSMFRTKLAAATQQLADAGREAAGDVGRASGAALEQLDRAARSIEELIQFVRSQPPLSRACPTCANRVMVEATLCGSCWTKLSPVPL